ncbi:MAG: hypothetical protein LBH25_09295, partial [Fibromonadaceae bacterium]|nr:hypothetical protein [Fibromonadaceae bacterium]
DLQITEDSIVRNIIYTDTPCSFSLVDPFSGDKTAFSFNGRKDETELKKLSEKFPRIHGVIELQLNECQIYMNYKEYQKSIEWLWE